MSCLSSSSLLLSILLLFTCLGVSCQSPSIEMNSMTPTRPIQFQMDIYTLSHKKGTVQHIDSLPFSSISCWNLQSKHVGSLVVNDPLTRITFYRSSECQGSGVYSVKGSSTVPISIKARSVKVIKLRRLYLPTHDTMSL
ncbi:hypothetical protein BDF14DRAFT_1862244 [Spinellus fusiger]|nr:hypothetical protein BDF14DRAFT_1862244 [Spinellus fusiger]